MSATTFPLTFAFLSQPINASIGMSSILDIICSTLFFAVIPFPNMFNTERANCLYSSVIALAHVTALLLHICVYIYIMLMLLFSGYQVVVVAMVSTAYVLAA